MGFGEKVHKKAKNEALKSRFPGGKRLKEVYSH